MNIKKEILQEIRDIENDGTVKYLSENLDITHEQVKDLLTRYAFNRFCVTEDACSKKEVADLLKHKYLEQ